MRMAAPITEYIVGTTTYDLQSNATVMDRILRHNDGTISVAWTRSSEFNTAWSDRGTGYNFYDGSAWDAHPASSLESSRSGWPSMIATYSGREIAAAFRRWFDPSRFYVHYRLLRWCTRHAHMSGGDRAVY